MRFIHSADWHLGRILYGRHLTEDQSYLLDRFVEIVDEARPDAVLISGDIYDRAVPPTEAVDLLDEVLSRVVLGLGVQVVLIAGNHDSAQRISFGSKILGERGLSVVGTLDAFTTPVVIRDGHAEVEVFAIPYADPPTVRTKYGDDEVRDHQAAMRLLTDAVQAARNGKRRSVALAHAFVTGGCTSESERPLTVGGTGEVDGSLFDGFDYVALGHLHRPQSMNDGRVRYAGSLMKYSFAEAEHSKSASLVELDAKGGASVEEIELVPRYDLRVVEGKMSELESRAPIGPRDDYIQVRLEDRGPVMDAMARLRSIYPNVLTIQRPEVDLTPVDGPAARDVRTTSDMDLFRSFYAQVVGEPLTQEQEDYLSETLDAASSSAREVAQ